MDNIIRIRNSWAYSTRSPSAIVQSAKDWRYYESTIIQNEESNGAIYLEYQSSGAWKDHYKTWEEACVPLGKSRRQIDRLIKSEKDIRTECPNVVEAQALEKFNARPDPVTPKALPNPCLPPPAPPLPAHVSETLERLNRELAEAVAPKVNGHEVEPPRVVIHEIARDAIGFPIPEALIPTWNKRGEVQDMATLASKLRCAIESVSKTADHAADHFYAIDQGWQHYRKALDEIYYYLAQIKPFAVCPYCKGDKCSECRETGFIGEKKATALKNATASVTVKMMAHHLTLCKNGHLERP